MDRLTDIRAFIAVAEAGSFVGGARRLGLAPARVSKLVARLEAELQARLLHRTTRELALTDAGRTYLDRARILLEEFDALQNSVSDAGAPRGVLTLSAPVAFGETLEPLLLDFAEAHPAVTLSVTYSDRRVNLVEEGIDVAVRVAPLGDASLVARRLATGRLVTCAAPAWLAAHGTPRNPAEVAHHAVVIDLNRREPFEWNFGRHGRERSVRIDGRLRFARAGSCLEAAARGFGLARAPDFAALPYLRSGRLVPILSDWAPEPLTIYAVYPQRRHLPGRVRALVEFLAARFANTSFTTAETPSGS